MSRFSSQVSTDCWYKLCAFRLTGSSQASKAEVAAIACEKQSKGLGIYWGEIMSKRPAVMSTVAPLLEVALNSNVPDNRPVKVSALVMFTLPVDLADVIYTCPSLA